MRVETGFAAMVDRGEEKNALVGWGEGCVRCMFLPHSIPTPESYGLSDGDSRCGDGRGGCFRDTSCFASTYNVFENESENIQTATTMMARTKREATTA